jgi:hypothetical protein
MMWRRAATGASSDVTVQLVPLHLAMDSEALPLLSRLGLFMDLRINGTNGPRRLHRPPQGGAVAAAAGTPTRTETAKVIGTR